MGIFNPLETLSDFIENPIDTTVREVSQPLRDTVSVIEGLSEGELRTRAIARLGVDVVSGMALSEVIDFLKTE